MMLAQYITLYSNFAEVLQQAHGGLVGSLRLSYGGLTVCFTIRLTYGRLAVAVRLPCDLSSILI